MRLLLDESLPRGLREQFPGHEVATVQEMGWAGYSNGELLRLAEKEFDVFLTADQNLEYQQHLRGFDLGVVVLRATRTRMQELLPLVSSVSDAIDAVVSGEVLRVSL